MMNLQAYYAKRASEYERIYHKPERQTDLELLTLHLGFQVQRLAVLELACGTGFWTQSLSETASSILATDVNPEVIEVAQQKTYGCPVQFQLGDAYHPAPTDAEVVFAGFWFSHIPLQQVQAFVDGIRAAVGRGKKLILIDNRYVEGSSTPISRTDEAGNTWQLRKLDSGETFEVLKNFPSRQDLLDLLGGVYWECQHFWCLTTTT